MRIFFVSTFVGTFLPASVGGDAVRAVMPGAASDVPARASVASVFMDRMLGVLSMLLMALVGLVFARQLAASRPSLGALAVTAAVCAVAAAGRLQPPGRRIGRVVRRPRFRWRAASRVGRASLRRCRAALRDLATASCSTCSLARSASRCCASCRPTCWAWRSASRRRSTAYFAFIPLILLVMLLPITVNGLGHEPGRLRLVLRAGRRAAAGLRPLGPLRGARHRRQPARRWLTAPEAPAARQRSNDRDAGPGSSRLASDTSVGTRWRDERGRDRQAGFLCAKRGR